jgi:hypothetical protein
MNKRFTKDNVKVGLYAIGGLILIYYVSDLVRSWINKAKPTEPTPEQKKAQTTQTNTDSGIIKLVPKGSGENTKRRMTDVYLTELANKFYEATDGFVDQSKIINSFIPIKTDADFIRMSEIFGKRSYWGGLQTDTLLEAFNEYADNYTKARINQSWRINKKYPTLITFTL